MKIMEKKLRKFKCNKTLLMENGKHMGKPCFVEGNEYVQCVANEVNCVTLTDENGGPHTLGGWIKHFTEIN
jgi:hypothetical protein